MKFLKNLSRRNFFQNTWLLPAAASSAAAAAPPRNLKTASVYQRLGVRTFINAVGTLTTRGGTLMPPEVKAAMEDASTNFVMLHELQEKVGARLAELSGAEDAFVTSGASCSLCLATCAGHNVAASRWARGEYLGAHPLRPYRMLPEVQEALRIMTYQEYRDLILAVSREDFVVGVYTVILGETGMRKSEGLRLKWADIHDRMLAIGKAKSGKVRSVPLSDLALDWLSKLIRFIDIPYVFVDPARHEPWKGPRGPFERAREKAGLEWVSFHDLRHFRATQWLMSGVDVNTVKELLGHSSIQTTMRYVHYVQSHGTQVVLEAQKREAQAWESTASVDANWTTGP